MCLFKQKSSYELRISDWSSDVCSSDLHVLGEVPVLPGDVRPTVEHGERRRDLEHVHGPVAVDLLDGRVVVPVLLVEGVRLVQDAGVGGDDLGPLLGADRQDRKSVVEGKSGSVRVDLGGRRLIKKKQKINILIRTR